MKITTSALTLAMLIILTQCRDRKDDRTTIKDIDLKRGDIALCGTGQFGKVEFSFSCNDDAKQDFQLATALLHSFEYDEAEKMFAKVIDKDPNCVMAFWGVAMCNFHPLWAPPDKAELEKGAKVIAMGRSLTSPSKKETAYLEAIAVIYDNWQQQDHKTRLLKFEKAAEEIYHTYPADVEAAIFYSLALRAAADPTDKSFSRQKKAGDILNSLFSKYPDHPGIAHYLIHTFDYPELATLALPAAKKYASIAATSAHALHMPSHIFTRLGLWDESVQSNKAMIEAAKCYAESLGMTAHWDEELHGIDYLVYAYLQQGNDSLVSVELKYLNTITDVFPINNKEGYTFAAVPTRFALERKNWQEAAALKLLPANFPWDDYPWEASLVSFGRVLGAANLGDVEQAKKDMEVLKANHQKLLDKQKLFEAKQVLIQVKASEAWIAFASGDQKEAILRMVEAADMEDATDKPPVTPGEVLPARELLGDMYMALKQFDKALEAYEADLKRHTGRFNGLYGAALAASQLHNEAKANYYFTALMKIAPHTKRPAVRDAKKHLANKDFNPSHSLISMSN